MTREEFEKFLEQEPSKSSYFQATFGDKTFTLKRLSNAERSDVLALKTETERKRFIIANCVCDDDERAFGETLADKFIEKFDVLTSIICTKVIEESNDADEKEAEYWGEVKKNSNEETDTKSCDDDIAVDTDSTLV